MAFLDTIRNRAGILLTGDDVAVLHGDGDLRQGLGGGALDDPAGEGVVPRAVAGASSSAPLGATVQPMCVQIALNATACAAGQR